MPHRALNPDEAAAYLHLSRADFERLMRETDLPREERGGRVVFRRGELDAWASRRILGLPEKRLDAYHQQSLRGIREVLPQQTLIPELLAPAQIDLAIPAKTRASVIRDMVALAKGTGRVYDPRELLESIEAREDLCPTALPGGLALLHARHHQEYRFEGSFMVLGRTLQPIPFSAPDGRPTSLFFLICCQDERLHLHTLARLALLVTKTHVLPALRAAASADLAYQALVDAEREVLPAPAEPEQ